MIRYALRCEFDHEFEAWFSNSVAFDDQKARALIECPHCGSLHVDKAIMAPMVRTSETADARQADATKAMREALFKVRKHVEQNFDYVGDSFAKEARDMHDGVAPERAIYGEASREEIRELVEDGVPIAPLSAASETPAPKSKALN